MNEMKYNIFILHLLFSHTVKYVTQIRLWLNQVKPKRDMETNSLSFKSY